MYDDLDPGPAPMPAVRWNIGRQGRAWSGDEAHERWELTPEKFEMDRGKLFWDETQRLTLLALLLENVGVDQAVRLGDPEVWRAAVRAVGLTDVLVRMVGPGPRSRFTVEKPTCAEIFVDFGPPNPLAVSDKLPAGTLSWCCPLQAPRPEQRHTDPAAVAEEQRRSVER